MLYTLLTSLIALDRNGLRKKVIRVLLSLDLDINLSIYLSAVFLFIYQYFYISFYVFIFQVIVDPNVISIFRELPQADILVNSIYSCDYKKFFEGVGLRCLSSLSIC